MSQRSRPNSPAVAPSFCPVAYVLFASKPTAASPLHCSRLALMLSPLLPRSFEREPPVPFRNLRNSL